jgi:hypothetical protein
MVLERGCRGVVDRGDVRPSFGLVAVLVVSIQMWVSHDEQGIYVLYHGSRRLSVSRLAFV